MRGGRGRDAVELVKEWEGGDGDECGDEYGDEYGLEMRRAMRECKTVGEEAVRDMMGELREGRWLGKGMLGEGWTMPRIELGFIRRGGKWC
jgi:hypothetical protein